MVLRHSLNVGSVVGIPWGGGFAQTQLSQKNLSKLLALIGGGDAKTSSVSTRVEPPGEAVTIFI